MNNFEVHLGKTEALIRSRIDRSRIIYVIEETNKTVSKLHVFRIVY